MYGSSLFSFFLKMQRCLSHSHWLILTQWQPRCKGGLINIHHMPPNEVNRA